MSDKKYSVNPATEERISTWDVFSDAQIDESLNRADSAFDSWSQLASTERGKYLKSLSELLRRDKHELALIATREMGKSIKAAEAEVAKCADLCEYYAEEGPALLVEQPRRLETGEGVVRYDPLGVILSVAPWNFPFWQVFRAAVPSFILGNTVVLKHASNVLGCADAIDRLFKEAGWPDGVFQSIFVENEDVEKIIKDKRIAGVCLTGSERAGASVAKFAGEALKPCVLELGGSDPFIVLKDADIEAAAKAAAQSRFMNSGQVCISAKRIIIEHNIYDDFVEAFVTATQALKMGNPEDPDTVIGPMAREDLRDELDKQVEKSIAKGAIARTRGGPTGKIGWFYAPTILENIPADAPAAREETFGPVAALFRVSTPEDAIRLANDTTYGLSSAIWTRNIKQAQSLAARIQAGNVFINGASTSIAQMPFGGIKRSGFGRELGHHGLYAFANVKSVVTAGSAN